MIGKTVSHYRIVEKLGEGGMGAVYRAEDTKLKRIVALKFLPSDLTSDPEARERFVREAQAASSLDHPNICTVHEIDATEDGQLFIAMACCQGESLKNRIQRGPLALEDAVDIATQVAQGLSKAHARSIVHRDIKPGNIVVTEDGIAKIVDFGLAKPAGRTSLTRAGTTLGTAAYMSPEQARGDAVDQRTDVWSLGVVLYEMLAGERPFKSEYEQALVYSIINEEPRPLTSLRPEVPWALEQTVSRAMAKNADERYQSAEEMLADLRTLSRELEAESSKQAQRPGQAPPRATVGLSPETQPIPATEARSTAQLPPAPGLRQQAQDKDRAVFVARELELERLRRALDEALSGRGRVLFVTGEAGSGKTALIAEFAKRAEEANLDVVVASGSCNAHTGVGDPYSPFREILGLLTGDVEASCAAGTITTEHATRLWNMLPASAQALVDTFPDLIDTFVTGARLVSRAAAFSAGRAAWLPRLRKLVERKASVPADSTIQQSNLFEQYTRMLQTLAGRNPLLLFLDDLQWADAGSIGLLFHLGRRLDGHRILLLGSYRPAEVAQSQDGGRRQLVSIVNELKRTFGEVEVPVGEVEDPGFVNAYLDSEPNQLGAAFRETLFRHTKGHPLFTIELLRGMRDKAMLVRDDKGRWVEGAGLDWGALPARIDAVIGERVGRLSEELRSALTLASVEGEEFTAEVLAASLQRETGEVVHLLSGELDKRHHLVNARGVKRVGSQRLSLYKFQHILFQKYLYASLDEIERSHLHEQIGGVLESFYGEQAEEIAVRLARHFQEAGIVPKAIDYLLLAGKRAGRMSANQEAIAHFNRALELLKTIPETEGRAQKELTLQLALVLPWQASKGFAAPELGKATARARSLCQMIGDTQQSFEALAQLATYYATVPQYRTSLELGEQLRAIAGRADDRALDAIVNYTLTWPLLNVAEFDRARECAERMIEFYDPEKHGHWAYLYGYDFGVIAFSFGSIINWFLGFPDTALRWGRESVAVARRLGHPFTLAFSLTIASELHWFLRDPETVNEYTDELIPLAAEKRFVYWEGHGVFYRGERWTLEGRVDEGIAEMRRGLAMMRGTGTETCLTRLLTRVADACRKVGEIEKGLSAVSEAIELVRRFDERYMEAELHRLRGELLLARGGLEQSPAEAESCFLQSLEVSRKQSAKSWEVRAAMSLSRLWTKQGRPDEARELLSGVYGWFTEGFDTPDLKEARALLEGKMS
jgi:predicted ATPase